MNQGQTLPQSADKNNRRPSILKGSSSKNRIISTNKKGPSTTIAQTVKFKEPTSEQKDIREFRQDSSLRQFQKLSLQKKKVKEYSELMLMKDVKLINNIYKHIFLMITSADQQFESDKSQSKDIKRIVTAIQKVVLQNIHIKQQIQEEYKHVADLHQVADYLMKTPEQLLAGTALQDFLIDYRSKQQELQVLQRKCELLRQNAKHKIKGNTLTEQQKKEKEKRCRQLRKQIEKQRRKIIDLQKQQKQLLNNLYKAEKQIIKNERASSTLKMKINEIQCQRSYKQMKSKKQELNRNHTQQKENNSQPSQQQKYFKIQNRERIKSKKSLAKFFQK